MSDFVTALLFWLVYEALTLPLRWILLPFAMSPELRRLMSRVAGPGLLAMVAGVLAHGGVSPGAAPGWLLAGIAAIAAATLTRARGGAGGLGGLIREALPVAPGRWRRDLPIEAACLGIYLGYIAFRRLAPEMTFEIQNSGAEKFPNAMLFWSCWHAESLPPEDYWFAGLPQAYYYGGHFFWSWIGRLGGFAPEGVIALGLARAVTLVTEASIVLLRALGLNGKAALLGAILIAWGGNPQAWVTLRQQYELQSRLTPPVHAEDSHGIRHLTHVARNWDPALYSFWEPSRVIANTVNEFPAWSAILGDFHAHHLALPWLIGWFAMLAGGDRWFRVRRGPPNAGAGGVVAGAIVFSGLGTMSCLANVWSVPVVLAACPAVLLWRGRDGRSRLAPVCVMALAASLAAGFGLGGHHPLAPLASAVPAGGGAFSSWPVGILEAGLRSTDGELLRLWGFQAVPLAATIFYFVVVRERRRRALAWLLCGAGLVGAKMILSPEAIAGRQEPALYWMGLACGVLALANGSRPWLPARAAAAGAGACLLLAGLELVYVRDRMTGELARYNSYFKFSYAAWPLLSAVAWMAAVRLWRLARPGALRVAARFALAATIPCIAGLPAFAAPARVLQARIGDAAPRRPTLDAFAWLANRPGYEAEAGAMAWIRENVPAGEAVASAAPSSAYSYQGRVASLAGRPIPLGWAHHEAQWRGAAIYDALTRRHEEVNAFYQAGTVEQMREAAKALGVRWAIMGRDEKETYGAASFGTTLEILRGAGRLRAGFPADAPEVYVFELAAD